MKQGSLFDVPAAPAQPRFLKPPPAKAAAAVKAEPKPEPPKPVVSSPRTVSPLPVAVQAAVDRPAVRRVESLAIGQRVRLRWEWPGVPPARGVIVEPLLEHVRYDYSVRLDTGSVCGYFASELAVEG
jgi:hypothetical protein